MANRNHPLRHIRLVYRRTPIAIKVVVLSAIVLSTATLLTLRGGLLNAQAQTDALRNQAQQLEQEKEKLEEYINELGSVDSVDRIAEEELGLVDPDSVIFQPNG